MKIAKKLIRWGGSLGITIPDDMVVYMDLKAGDLITVDIEKTGVINLNEVKLEILCNVCGLENFVTQSDIDNGFIECRGCSNNNPLNQTNT